MKKFKTIVYTLGVYDNFHMGHLRLLERASLLGDKLVVGIVKDEAVKRQKGENRPRFSLRDRKEIVSALACVDETIPIIDFDPNELIRKHRNASGFFGMSGGVYLDEKDKEVLIFVFGSDQHHLKRLNKIYDYVIGVTISRTPGISTTEILGGEQCF